MTPAASTTYRRAGWIGAVLIGVGCLAGIIAPAGSVWDFANFYDAGHKVLAGQNEDLFDPLAPIEGQPPQGAMQFWGVPLSAYLYAPLALLPPPAALVAFKIAGTLALFGGLWILFRHLGGFAGPGESDAAAFGALFVWAALAFQPFWTIYRIGGQATPFVFLLLTIGLVSHLRGRFAVSSLCFVVAVLIKPFFVTALAVVVLLSGLRFLGWTAAWGVGFGLLSLATTGWEVHLEFVRYMLRGSGLSNGVLDLIGLKQSTWMHNSALTVPLENLRLQWDLQSTSPDRPAWLTASVLAVRLLVLTVFVRLMLAARRQCWLPAARRHFVYLVGIMFSLLFSTIVWDHYLSLLFLPLAWVLASRRHIDHGARWLLASVFVVALGQNLIFVLWLEAHFRFDTPLELLAVGLFKAAPLLLSLILMWRYQDDLFRTYSSADWNGA